MDETKCFICLKGLSKGIVTTVKEKGIKTLIQSSKERKDSKHKYLKDKSITCIHEKCRLVYNRKSNIKCSLVKPIVPGKTRSSAQELDFDFKKKCFFCGNVADGSFIKQELKKPIIRRDTVHHVSTEDFQGKVIELAEKKECDERAKVVLNRLTNLSENLIKLEARYHGSCSKKFFSRWVLTQESVGRPQVDEVSNVVQHICNFIEGNEDCQFTLAEILDGYTGYIPPDKTIINRLFKIYGDDIVITTAGNQYKQTVICFKDTAHAILTDKWYESRSSDTHEERLRIVKAAADIIRQDIRSQMYDMDTYPKPDSFFNDVNKDVPKSLQLMLDSVISPKGDVKGKKKTKVTSIAHAIITATRPRSFHSAIQIGVGALLYKKYGSRDLLEVLSALGFCSSYNTIRLFEVSCLKEPVTVMHPNSLIQFVFDNADVNIDTLDGTNTFHAMGGIQVTTPKPLVSSCTDMKRVKKIPSTDNIAQFGKIPVVTFHKSTKVGLASIPIKNIAQINTANEAQELLPKDFIWSYGKWKGIESIPGWNGFMETMMSDMTFSKSDILFLPFINAPPSNYDTIYTALLTSAEKTRSLGQQNCFVTFDQPLYIKARDIIAANHPQLRPIIVRLGGFHLIMSFMGAIGFIMDGSGLQELFGEAYAVASVTKMMSGHAYSRALRAHILTHLALTKMILCMIDITEEEESEVLKCLLTFEGQSEAYSAVIPGIKTVLKKFNDKLIELEKSGATAKLWVTYYRMVTILKNFVAAERSGDWSLHLECIKEMLPYFHSSGHFLYAKSCHLYLQDMSELESRLTPEHYELFVNKGYFTIRRSDKFWSGIWSDMTIEQTLMRSLKSVGGLTRGRGLADSTLAKWIATMPIMMTVSEEVEKFCGVTFCTTEQHVDSRLSRIVRDHDDVEKFLCWFMSHYPFPSNEYVMSLSTGVIGDEKINCHLAYEIGVASIKSVIGSDFANVKIKRTNRVVPMKAFTSAVKIHDEEVTVNPETIFRRISFHKKSEEELKSFFEYELAPYPTSLFDHLGMRKTRKSVFYDLFTPLDNFDQPTTPAYVIDGGFLLHRVNWEMRDKIASILLKYVEYVKKNYGTKTTIVFDGYPEESKEQGTKSAERTRRKNKYIAASVNFDETTAITMQKEHFLANEGNKRRLIAMLSEKLNQENLIVKQASEDADTLIVRHAIEVAQESEPVIIVGNDIDILVLLTAFAPDSPKIFFLKPGKGKTSDVMYSPMNFKYSPTVKRNILFLHAFSGCDSTSATFRQGKIKFVKLIDKHDSLKAVANVFSNPLSPPHEVGIAGQTFIASLYKSKPDTQSSLNKMRYEAFAKYLINSQFNLASLPPTEDAANQHSYRTFLQIHIWNGRKIKPTEWGWKSSRHGILPNPTNVEAAPPELLNTISCKCAKGCKGGCTCRKHGVECTSVCYHCKGTSCSNSPKLDSHSFDVEDEFDDEVLDKREEHDEQNEDKPWKLSGPSKNICK